MMMIAQRCCRDECYCCFTENIPGSSSISGSGSCVYLRPEQNIPEVFANPGNSVFKPIDEVDGNNSDVNDNNDLAGNSNRSETTGAISRDDIVVTMRSVNV